MAEVAPVAAAMVREWDTLADRVGADPFVRPGWIAAWWQAFGSGTLEVMCARRGAELAGVLPLARRGRRLRSPTNYHTPQFAPVADGPGARWALATAAFGARPSRLSIGFLDSERSGFPELEAAAGAAGYRVLSRTLQRSPYVTIEPDWEAYQRGMSRNARSDLRRCGRRLREAGATIEFGDSQQMLEDALAVEAGSWKAARGTAITSRPATRRFYEDVSAWAARRGWLRLAVMYADGGPVAMEVGLSVAGVHYTLKGSYDARYVRFAPGRVLLHAVIERAAAEGVGRIELLGADDAYKHAWTRQARDRRLVEAFDRTPAGALQWLAEVRGRPLARRVGVRRALTRMRRE